MGKLLSYISRRFQLSPEKKIIVENLFWSVVGKVVTLAGGLLVGILIGRYLGPEKYGLMNYVFSCVFLFQVFAIFGLDAIEVREEARAVEPIDKIIGTAFGIKVVSGFVFMGGVIALSLYMDSDLSTTLLIAIYSVTIVLNSFSVIRNYFTSIVQNKYIVRAEIERTVIGVVVKAVLLLCGAGLTWFVAAYAFDGLLLAGGYLKSYHQKAGSWRKWTFDSTYARYLLKESFPLMLTSAAVIVYQRIDQVMIGQMIDNESLGYFSVASRFVEVLVFVPIMLSQTITPLLVKAREHSLAEYEQKAQRFMNMSVWLSLIAAAVVSLVSFWLVRFTFGSAYLPAVAILQVMSFKAAAVALSNTAGSMLVTEGLQRWAILRDGLGCATCVVLNYLLLPRYGVMAAAVVAIVSAVVAGYLADAFIPAYRHLFVKQTKALALGWRELIP